jgi:hypothetical protein
MAEDWGIQGWEKQWVRRFKTASKETIWVAGTKWIFHVIESVKDGASKWYKRVPLIKTVMQIWICRSILTELDNFELDKEVL